MRMKFWLVTTVHGSRRHVGNVVGHLSLGTGRKVPSPHAWLMLRSEKLVALLMVLPTPSSS